MCRCKLASATGAPVGRVPVDVFIARGGARRDVADARVRSGRVPQPHTGCCFVLHLLAQVVAAHFANSVIVVTRGGSSQEPQVKAWTLTR